LIQEIMDAVLLLSATKTGAIITFVKNDPLDNYIKAGELVHAPVTSRLLRTIFTPGTPLHDGAVIIKGNMVEAASVFYTPTTRALTGKYGARHRAAMGISEMCDALTIVVSEETGRISFTQAGEIYGISRENFEKHLRDRLL
jgi:diadenylate cyclase